MRKHSFFRIISSFIFLLLSGILIQSCNKDSINELGKPQSIALDVPKISINAFSLKDAQDWFEKENLSNQIESRGDNGKTKILFKKDPDWNKAYKSKSKNGRDYWVIPIKNNQTKKLNGDKADVKMVIAKTKNGTTIGGFIVFLAEDKHFKSKKGNLSMSDYTGAFMFLGLDGYLNRAIYVQSGKPAYFLKNHIENPTNIIKSRGYDDCVSIGTTPITLEFDCCYDFNGKDNCSYRTYFAPVCDTGWAYEPQWGSFNYPDGFSTETMGGGSSSPSPSGGLGSISSSDFLSAVSIYAEIPWDVFVNQNPDNAQLKEQLRTLYREVGLNDFEFEYLMVAENQWAMTSIMNFYANNKNSDAKELIKYHILRLQQDAQYYNLSKEMSAASLPPFVWEMLKDIGVEIAVKLIQKYVPGFNEIGNLKNALQAISQGDMLEFSYAVLDIARTELRSLTKKLPWLAAYEILFVDGKAFYEKAEKIITTLQTLQNRISDNVITRIWKAMSKNSNVLDKNVLDKFEVINENGFTNFKLFGSVKDFFSSVASDANITPKFYGTIGTKGYGLYFNIGNVYFNYYYESSTAQTPTVQISINGLPSSNWIPSNIRGNGTVILKFRQP